MRIQREHTRLFAERDFEESVAATIREVLPIDSLLRMNARQTATHCIAVAREYGFEFENDIVTFVLHMVTINPEYHRQADIFRILTDPAVPISEKHNILLHPKFEHAWEQAATMADSKQYWACHIAAHMG